MRVKGIDHVNIIAADLDETAEFYGKVLDLRREQIPGMTGSGLQGYWLRDPQDQAVIHVMAHNAARHGEGDRRSMPTGSIDHIAFACEDFDGMAGRLDNLGLSYKTNRRPGAFSQIVLTDPNNIDLELNFAGE